MTISAVIATLAFSDLGINNGLLNAIAKANGSDDRLMAAQYVSSAFFLLSVIALLLAAAFAVAYPWISWASLFRVRSAMAMSEAGPAVAVFAGCFILNIPAGIVARIQSGYQEGYVANLWASLGSVMCLLSLLLVVHFHGTLPFLVLALAGAPILSLVLNGVVQFGIKRPWLMPSFRKAEVAVSKDLLHLGLLFFILQLGGAIGFSSDNIVLARIMGPEAVAQYAVPCRLFSLVSMACSFLTAPLWPAYGEAMVRRDYQWIRRTLYRSLLLVFIVSAFLSAALVAFGSRIIHVWVGSSIHPSPLLLVGLGIWGVVSGVCSPVAMFLNGLSVIRFQVILCILGAFTNIVLSVYLTKRIGIPGVVFGSIITQVFVGFFPFYWYISRYLKRRLHGEEQVA
jgi:O-antigen/teichoic acid export membrane protein